MICYVFIIIFLFSVVVQLDKMKVDRYQGAFDLLFDDILKSSPAQQSKYFKLKIFIIVIYIAIYILYGITYHISILLSQVNNKMIQRACW